MKGVTKLIEANREEIERTWNAFFRDERSV
jgi:hypothetical protein